MLLKRDNIYKGILNITIMVRELVRTREELERLASLMADEIQGERENVVSRYIQTTSHTVQFIGGKAREMMGTGSNLNKEKMMSGIFTSNNIDLATEQNFREVAVARDLQPQRFRLALKGFSLPTQQEVFDSEIPTEFSMHDTEFKAFTQCHPNTRIRRDLAVDQRIVVNSKGGIMIQTVPFFNVSFSYGYAPIPMGRDLSVVCRTNDDLKKLNSLTEFIADPTPDKRVKRAGSLVEAFHRLYKIAGLKYGGLEKAGIPLSELYDVVMLTGVPVHEIFGHHFEEPVRFLEFGESGTFKQGQSIRNRDIVLEDNPHQKVAGFEVLGFTYFDAYGRLRRKVTHIKDGEIHGFLGSEYADDSEKLKQYMNSSQSSFGGNATQDADGGFPQARMSCTVLDGKVCEQDLEGKIVMVSHEGHTMPADKTYLAKSYECYVVRDGEPRRVIPLQVTGGINQALANIELLKDFSYQTGMCSKSDPLNSGERVKVPVSQFTRSQIWRDQQVYPLPISDAHLRVLQGRD